jgi:thioredoxin reductase (NADPH)
MDYELAIIGAGPAGYTAAIYAVRAGIKTIVFDKIGGGGLGNLSPIIENYPGFESIVGMDLMNRMQKHALKYTDINFIEEVSNIQKNNDEFIVETTNGKYNVKAVLLCLGTEHRKLGVDGEEKFLGKGVSYCATCDGNFFKDKIVAVIGGGNSALIEAIYLKQIGCKQVFLIHRRDELRAEKAYEQDALKNDVEIIYHTHVDSIHGSNNVEYLQIHDVKTDEKSKLTVDGVFISVGVEPQNDLAKKLGCEIDDKGFVKVDKSMRTSVKGVYAAGDLNGGLRQVITACAEGAIAALSSTEAIGKQYPY